MPRETTEAMVRNIGRELAEIEQAMGRCRGDAAAEPVLSGTWMAHLLIDTARRPQWLEPTAAGDQALGSSVG
jgi:hypothetical protein